MRAIRFHEYGDVDVLRLDEIATPVPARDEVLVKVAATTFNPADVAIRSGAFADRLPLALPHTLGLDLAGTVESIGDEVTVAAPGDPVVAFLPPNLPGAAAEYVTVPAGLLAAAPTSVPLADAAALPSTGTTAWQALFELGKLATGQRVVINGGGGVVGGLAVQLAVGAGADVTAFAGTHSLSRVTGYGATRVLDYAHVAPSEAGRGSFDLVVNLAPTRFAELLPLVKPGGRLVSATSPVGTGTGITAIRMAARPDAGQLSQLVTELEAGRLVLHIGDRRPLSDTPAVHRHRKPGKTILFT